MTAIKSATCPRLFTLFKKRVSGLSMFPFSFRFIVKRMKLLTFFSWEEALSVESIISSFLHINFIELLFALKLLFVFSPNFLWFLDITSFGFDLKRENSFVFFAYPGAILKTSNYYDSRNLSQTKTRMYASLKKSYFYAWYSFVGQLFWARG